MTKVYPGNRSKQYDTTAKINTPTFSHVFKITQKWRRTLWKVCWIIFLKFFLLLNLNKDDNAPPSKDLLTLKACSTLAANSRGIKRFLTPTKKTCLVPGVLPPCGKTHFLPRLAASISNRFGAARGSIPAASVCSTRGKTWRQKPLDAA
jgi:hypothetical protein